MRQTLRAVWTSLCLIAILGTAPGMAQADSHLKASHDFVNGLADRAIKTLTATDIPQQDRREKFRELFREGFAINGIARYVLGRYWRKASDEERTEYLVLFEDVTVNIWADRFADYSGQKFQIDDAVDVPGNGNSKEHVALVRSTFYTDPRTPVRIEWRVASIGSLFKITDVTVEGISMATTQRDEYLAVIRNNGGEMSGLLAELRKRRDG